MSDLYYNTKYSIKISKAISLVAIYLGIMLCYTFLDVAVWRKVLPEYSNVINTVTIILCVFVFLVFLMKTGYQIRLLSNITLKGILLAIGCSILFFLVMDKGLDPILENIFPQSEESYQETVQSLLQSPFTSLLQVCVIAPFIEEILMRGVVLGGLKNTYGVTVALFLSSILFAALHFNMVQTLSALVCGIVLGLLYVKTNSIFCCIIAHCGYNLISYIGILYPYIHNM